MGQKPVFLPNFAPRCLEPMLPMGFHSDLNKNENKNNLTPTVFDFNSIEIFFKELSYTIP